ncbi:hypothetical protein IW262DRAFT_1469111 [Armillaria fumosa]|nr:hypothetical protein IW262DRAFT_1469111 [Armillaria fumosa]
MSMYFIGMLSFSQEKLYLVVTSTQQAMWMGVHSQAPSTCDMSASSTSSPSMAWTHIIATGSTISSSTISTTSMWSSTFSNNICGALNNILNVYHDLDVFSLTHNGDNLYCIYYLSK